jgi:tetratricopeptide (TPR) repeat protein
MLKTLQTLEEQLSLADNDTTKAGILAKMTSILADHDHYKAISYGSQALNLVRESDLPDLKVNVLNTLAESSRRAGEFATARKYARLAAFMVRDCDMPDQEAKALNTLGICCWHLGEQKRALESYLKALEIRQRQGRDKEVAGLLNNIGGVCMHMEDTELALGYYIRALELKKKHCTRMSISNTLNNMGVCYRRLGRYAEALGSFSEALQIRQLLDDRQQVARCLANMGRVYMDIGNQSTALGFCLRASILLGSGNKRYDLDMAILTVTVGEIFMKRGQVDLALKHAVRGLETAEKVGDLNCMMNAFDLLGSIYDNLGYHRKASHYRSRASNARNQLQCAETGRKLKAAEGPGSETPR